MARFLKNKEASMGKAPGELVFIGEQKLDESLIRVLDYDEENLNERYLKEIQESLYYKDTATVTWVNIYGMHDTALLQSVGEAFGLHKLVLEDIGEAKILDGAFESHLTPRAAASATRYPSPIRGSRRTTPGSRTGPDQTMPGRSPNRAGPDRVAVR